MKLCRFGPRGAEKPGLYDKAGKLRDLSGVISDFGPAELSRESLHRLSGLDLESLPEVGGDVRLGVPVARIPQIVAIGLNYEDHAIEANLPIPAEPATFLKSVSSLNGPYDDVMLPKDSEHSDWELELGVFIGKTARYVTEAEAPGHIAGYCVVNDLSERFNQKQRGSQWSKGKGADTFCPVGEGIKPDPIYLKAGDEMRFGIEQLGEQTHQVVAWRHLDQKELS